MVEYIPNLDGDVAGPGEICGLFSSMDLAVAYVERNYVTIGSPGLEDLEALLEGYCSWITNDRSRVNVWHCDVDAE